VLRSTESHDLIPALSVAEIMTCEQAELYSPEAMHQQLLDSSNTAVHISELKMIINNARETVRLKRVNAWNPFVRMAAPAEVEGPADKSQTAGEHAALEPSILPEGAYRVSLGNKYRPLRASEHEPEREIRLTTSCIYGRSLVPAVVTNISRGTAMEPYYDRHTEATVWEARHRSAISRTRMDVSGEQVSISQGTSTMSRTTTVAGDQSTTVAGSGQSTTVAGGQSTTVAGSGQSTTMAGGQSTTVAGSGQSTTVAVVTSRPRWLVVASRPRWLVLRYR
jgi:hypothetical protein